MTGRGPPRPRTAAAGRRASRGPVARSRRTAPGPAVTMPQNAVRASDATARRGAEVAASCTAWPSCRSSSRTMPYSSAKTANTQKRAGSAGAARPPSRRRRPSRPGERQRQRWPPASAGEQRAPRARAAPTRRRGPGRRADEERRQRRAEPQQGVEVRGRPGRPRTGRTRPRACSATGTVRPKPTPRLRRGEQQHGVGRRARPSTTWLATSSSHRDEVGGQAQPGRPA